MFFFKKNNLYFSEIQKYFTVDKYSPLNLIFICYFAFFLNLAFTIFNLWVWVYTLTSWRRSTTALGAGYCLLRFWDRVSLLTAGPWANGILLSLSPVFLEEWGSTCMSLSLSFPGFRRSELTSSPLSRFSSPLFIINHLATSLTFYCLEVTQNLDLSRRRADF